MIILLELECGHVREMSPAFYRNPVMCYQCNTIRKVNDVITRLIHVRCKLCTLSRWTGLSLQAGNELANRHARKANHHDVTVKEELFAFALEVKGRLERQGRL